MTNVLTPEGNDTMLGLSVCVGAGILPLMIQDPPLESAVVHFVESFALVFDNDWNHTKGVVTEDDFIDPSGTFIDPKVEDESNNWGNRGSLLLAYRGLVSLLKERGVPLADFVNH